MIDLSDHIERRKLVSLIQANVETHVKQTLTDEPRKHLGASIIGDDCQAKLWNDFRWIKREDFEGRMLRLFDRGQREEAQFVSILRGIGFDVRELAEDGKQFRIAGVDGHFGGSLDGMALAPEWLAIAEPLLLEFKTHNEKSFVKLLKDGVRISKPKHFSQMCCYGRAYSLRYALYCAVNKNNDELHFEIVPLDWTHADDLFRKADSIIRAQEQPQKIAQVETFFKCKYCHYSPVCFRGEAPEKNCRSCKWATPVEGGRWGCMNVSSGFDILTPETIASGCASWKAIVNAA